MPEPTSEAVTFTLDGREITANKGEAIIAAAERAGTYIPRFCYHPRMAASGNCRMCLVEVDGPRGSTLMPSCFVAAGEGMSVVTNSEKVKKAQDGVLEFLLANHPLDCPVCDKGGECPLQDQTLLHGPGETRFVEEKRHFEKPIALSELVLLDRERCIQCARCTRFADEIAGEPLIDFAGRGDRVEVSTFPGEPFSSYFAGNTVQICPVGALTATPYRFAARPWDLDQVESTCTGCATGCRVAVQSSQGRITRLLGVDVDTVNHGWLCDKGRFAFDGLSIDEEGLSLADPRRRITEPMVRKNNELVTVSWSEAIKTAAGLLRSVDAHAVGAIGGANLTNEGAFAWATLLKGIVGTDSVDAQLGDGLDASIILGLPRATINEAADACTLIVLAGDLREELPVLFLRLRAGAAAKQTSIIDLTNGSSCFDKVSALRLPLRPGDAPTMAAALLGSDDATAALLRHPEGGTFDATDIDRARHLIGSDGTGVVVVVGRPSLAEDAAFVEDAALALHQALPKATFLPAIRRGNLHGALDMGMAPGIAAGRVTLTSASPSLKALWTKIPSTSGRSTLEQLRAMDHGEQRVTVVIGADISHDVPDGALVDRALQAKSSLIAVTGNGSSVVAAAQVVLPTPISHERGGTTTNLEGRVSRLGQKVVAPGDAWEDWMLVTELAHELGVDLPFGCLDDVTNAIAALAPSHSGLTTSLLASSLASDGIIVPLGTEILGQRKAADPMAIPGLASADQIGLGSFTGSISSETPLASEQGKTGVSFAAIELPQRNPIAVPAPDSYALRLISRHKLYDLGTATSASPALSSLAASAVAKVNAYDLDRIGATSGNQVRLRSTKGAMVIAVEADGGVARGTIAIDFNVRQGDETTNAVLALLDSSERVIDVRMESLS
jgi:NADH-quinone oxidoreductase subunit G